MPNLRRILEKRHPRVRPGNAGGLAAGRPYFAAVNVSFTAPATRYQLS